jgi:hypothetical protein
MDEHVRRTSGDRCHRFTWRQVHYTLREVVRKAIGAEPDWNYFSQTLVNEYESEYGKEQKAYRDPRGTLYIPHTRQEIPLGTLAVEQFQRPPWIFNKVLYIEKEGFSEILKDEGWMERHDCAVVAGKGQPTGAARDLIDLLGETDEPAQIFCLHDCDAPGTVIYQSIQEATKTRPRRVVEVIDLGLHPAEAVELARRGVVTIEDLPEQKRTVARHVDAR